VIVVPGFAWKAVVDAFTTALGIAERVAFLDGVAAGPSQADGGVVTTVTLPDARERDGDWEVDAEEMRRAGRHLRPYGLVRLAQVHSHPATWTGHSETDDERAFSHQTGAISIVLPGYALTYPGLTDAGVHLRERSSWRELEAHEVHDYVRVVPSLIDRRRPR
jgi:hypothetical protein